MISVSHNYGQYRMVSDKYLDLIVEFDHCDLINSKGILYNESSSIYFNNC